MCHLFNLFFREALPDLVVYPENVEQISKILKICNANKIPVIPFGAGSGFEGGINAVHVIIQFFSFLKQCKNFKIKHKLNIYREVLRLMFLNT